MGMDVGLSFEAQEPSKWLFPKKSHFPSSSNYQLLVDVYKGIGPGL